MKSIQYIRPHFERLYSCLHSKGKAMDSKEITEFKCRKCGAVVAKRQGNLLFTDGQIMSLFHGGFAFPCECGETFYFDFRKAGLLPTRGQLSSKDTNKPMLWAA
jgi:hypothetical protein